MFRRKPVKTGTCDYCGKIAVVRLVATFIDQGELVGRRVSCQSCMQKMISGTKHDNRPKNWWK